MLRILRPALLLATASVTAGVLVAPGAAFAADTTTTLTATQMAQALKAAAGTTRAAEAKGWAGDFRMTGGGESGSASFVTDPVGGRASVKAAVPGLRETTYAVANRGIYETLTTAKQRAAVKMIRKPGATFVFTPKTTLNVTSWARVNSADPAVVLTDDIEHAGTRTVHDDRSVTYRYDDGEEGSYTYQISAAGVLTGARINYEGYLDATYTWRYGAQRITLPTTAQTVGSGTLTKALAYVDLAADVRKLAKRGAADVRTAANKHTVKVSVLRKVVKRDVATFNRTAKVKVVTVTDITGGVRISAKNPWTGLKVTYTIKAAGKKVVVTKK
ncbi:hypothetical protein [Actinoplanes teichomyceticus]|uniref:Uncharacterized protein n=1 Tax=Actinoplanes teichomyceticus TaxID=1867 RepID=A0A561VGY7_ACTTI|nr:hypothetical protein [Actinoplanes teichomyceticus]TWG10873.1 hypothetical protein FHX34_107371 [Actinoplanes teichomyceticus]GIF12507.1 hypothetical protein Ate01nite_25390 [Actinoplanes teichomyceticus]